MIDLSLAKKYLRIEDSYTDEDDLINLMIENAESYIKNAGVIIDDANIEQSKLLQLLELVLVSDFYENREMTTKTSDKVRDIVTSIIMQLKYCYGDDAV